MIDEYTFLGNLKLAEQWLWGPVRERRRPEI